MNVFDPNCINVSRENVALVQIRPKEAPAAAGRLVRRTAHTVYCTMHACDGTEFALNTSHRHFPFGNFEEGFLPPHCDCGES